MRLNTSTASSTTVFHSPTSPRFSTMATVSRQPFAPVDGARLKSLASVKNRQNALANSPVKRKASEAVDVDDFENVAPVLFSKRSKGADPWDSLSKSVTKPPAFALTKVASSAAKDALGMSCSKLSSARPRSVLLPKSPAARLKVKNEALSPLTASAGRSPTRGSKRMGILSRRRTQRPDPPSFSLGASIPFSLDTALKGTIPSYSGNLRSKSSSSSRTTAADFFSSPTPDTKPFWSFDIYEDTPEQEMTNLLQHGTCTLDISSDEESDSRAGHDSTEGRDKENIPPPEDVSQTSSARGAGIAGSAAAADIDDDLLLLKGRGPLAEMNVTDFYAEGCDSTSVFIVPGDEEDPEATIDKGDKAALLMQQQEVPPLLNQGDDGDGQQHQYLFAAAEKDAATKLYPPQASLGEVEDVSVDTIMESSDRAIHAPMLGPIEGAGQSFELWESNSAKDEGDAPASPPPLPDAEEIS